MPKYKVIAINPQAKDGVQYQDKNGNKGWYLKLADEEGGVTDCSALFQKPPAVGDTEDGELKPQEYGEKTYYKFKRTPKANAYAGQPGGRSGSFSPALMCLAYAKDMAVSQGCQNWTPENVMEIADKFYAWAKEKE